MVLKTFCSRELWLLVPLFLSLFVTLSVQQTCTLLTSCSCKLADGNVIDLAPLDGGAFTPKFRGMDEPGQPLFKYDYNPCTAVANCDDQSNSAVCQRQTNVIGGPSFNCGNQNTAKFVYATNHWTIQYTATQSGTSRQGIVHLYCQESEEGKANFVRQSPGTAPIDWVYEINLSSKHACPKSSGGGGGGSSGGLSGGDILIIIVVVLAFVYFVGGIVINIFVRKVSGSAVVPNKIFWIAIPGLIKEGITFTISKTCKRNSYENLK